MFVRPSMHRLSVFFLTGAAVPLLFVGLGMAPNEAGSGAESEKIRKLLEEQRAVLKEAVQFAVRKCRRGRTDLDSVHGLRRDLLKVELQTAANREERIKLHEEFVELANDFEKIATELYRTGKATQVDVLKAQAAMLQSQIDLERAKLKDQQAGVVTEPVLPRKLYREINTTGRIVRDERRQAKITSWARGKSRIEKLHVDFTGAQVEKGDLMAELYSPELIVAQQEYLLTLNGPDVDLTVSARQRLLVQGMTTEQVDQLRRTKKVLDRIPIYAPLSGTVFERNVQEGQYVSEGEMLFQISDLDLVWLVVDIYEEELSLVELGQRVTLSVRSFPGETFEGTVAFIDPIVQPESRTVRVRIEVPNSERRLKPGMSARAQLRPNATISDAKSEKLNKLLHERKAVLGEAVRAAEREYHAGRIDVDSVLTLQRDLLNAELELAAGREERIELYRQFVENATVLEKAAAELFKSGQATQVDVLKAKAALLQSQIDLERAELKDD